MHRRGGSTKPTGANTPVSSNSMVQTGFVRDVVVSGRAYQPMIHERPGRRILGVWILFRWTGQPTQHRMRFLSCQLALRRGGPGAALIETETHLGWPDGSRHAVGGRGGAWTTFGYFWAERKRQHPSLQAALGRRANKQRVNRRHPTRLPIQHFSRLRARPAAAGPADTNSAR